LVAVVGWLAVARKDSSRAPVHGWVAVFRGISDTASDGRFGIDLMRADGSGRRTLPVIADGFLGWSPNGRKFAFVASDKRYDRIWIDVADRAGSHIHRVTPARWKEDCFDGEWSPDSRRLAISRVEGCEGDTAVYVVDADGTHLRRLAGAPASAIKAGRPDSDPASYSLNAAWSPDGRLIAFGRGFGSTRLSVMRADGSSQRPIGDVWMWGVGGPGIPPAWSPDGKRIFFIDGYRALSVINLDGSHHRRLLPKGFKVFYFELFPDGKRVAVDAGYQGHESLYVVDSDASHRRLLPARFHLNGFTLSPDGSRIAVDVSRAGRRSVYVINSDGSRLKRLAGGGASDWYLDNRIIYARTVGKHAQLYVMDADGSNQHSLTPNVADVLGADLSPAVR
jgi:Tol biopolymer transport system component